MSINRFFFSLIVLNYGVIASDSCAETLIVSDEQKSTLASGEYDYQRVEVGTGGQLILLGSVELTTEVLVLEKQAVIVLHPGDHQQAAASLTVTDQLEAQEMKLIGDGADGSDLGTGRAPDGRDGRDAVAKVEPSGFKVKPFIRPCTNGQPGSSGRSGVPGEAGARISLALPFPDQPMVLAIQARGGNGGAGQDGGHGGRGGRGTQFSPPCFGGSGGQGGNGGNGGPAGSIEITYFTDTEIEDIEQKLAKLRDLVKFDVDTSPGMPGRPGHGGFGGSTGAAKANFSYFDGAPLEGASGLQGQPGEGAIVSDDSLAEGFDLKIVVWP